jgi:hypothetical protein
MANPRNTERYDEIKPVIVTYKIDNSTITFDATKKGGSSQAAAEQGANGMLAVTLSADRTVKLAEDGEAIEGGLVHVESDNRAAIQVGGYMKLRKGNGATVTRGKKLVGALGASSAKGYVREVATATAAELGVARGRTVDNTDTSNPMVHLEA